MELLSSVTACADKGSSWWREKAQCQACFFFEVRGGSRERWAVSLTALPGKVTELLLEAVLKHVKDKKLKGSSQSRLTSIKQCLTPFYDASERDLNAPLPFNRRRETSCTGQKLMKFRCVSACTVRCLAVPACLLNLKEPLPSSGWQDTLVLNSQTLPPTWKSMSGLLAAVLSLAADAHC